MKATGATPADQARSLGLVVGDTIEGSEDDHTARLTLLWIGESVAVWREESRLGRGKWRDIGEEADWTLDCREWERVEVQR